MINATATMNVFGLPAHMERVWEIFENFITVFLIRDAPECSDSNGLLKFLFTNLQVFMLCSVIRLTVLPRKWKVFPLSAVSVGLLPLLTAFFQNAWSMARRTVTFVMSNDHLAIKNGP